MPNAYLVLKRKHQAEVDAFPLGFAFSQEGFARVMAEWGLTPEDTDQLVRIGGGGVVRKTDADAFVEMMARHAQEMQAAVDADQTGDGFVVQMFNYELGNHEFTYTGDVTDTLSALDLTEDMVDADQKLRHALDKAIASQ